MTQYGLNRSMAFCKHSAEIKVNKLGKDNSAVFAVINGYTLSKFKSMAVENTRACHKMLQKPLPGALTQGP